MTVTVNDRRIQYTATAGQTIFPYDFKIDANTEITVEQVVYLTGAINTLTLTTEYTVSGVGDAGGGNITLVTGAAVNDTITIIGNTPLSRTTDFNQAGDFLVSDLNNQLDKLTNILQENNTTINRAVKLKDSDTTSSLEIPTATNRASKFLAFDASGDAIASAGTTETTVSSFMATVLDDTTAAAARTTLGVAIGTDVQADVITTRGDIIRGSSSATAERLAIGSANKVLISDGTDISWGTSPKTTGDIVQVVNTETGAVATGTTTMPTDDTIPQNTEGDEYITLSITPTNASNYLQIEFVGMFGNSVTCNFAVALFQDSTANALAATGNYALTGTEHNIFTLKHRMLAGTTSATTFKIRAGGNNAGTTTFNGISGTRYFGGVNASSITITEIKV